MSAERHFTDPAIADALLRQHVDALDAARLSCVSRSLRATMRALAEDEWRCSGGGGGNANTTTTTAKPPRLPPSPAFAAAAAGASAAALGQTRVLGSVPKAHGAAVTCAASAGKFAATGAADGTVRVWDCSRLRGESAASSSSPLHLLRPGALAVSLARARAEGVGGGKGGGGQQQLMLLPPPAPVSAVAVAPLRPLPSYAAASSSSPQRPPPLLVVATATEPLRPSAALPLGAAPEVRLWTGSAPPGRLLSLGEAASTARVSCLVLAQSGALLLAGCEDGKVIGWETGVGGGGGNDPRLRFSVQAFERGAGVTALSPVVEEGQEDDEDADDDRWRRAGLESCRAEGVVLVGSAGNCVNVLDARSGALLLAAGLGGVPLGDGGNNVAAICGAVVSSRAQQADEWMSAALAVSATNASAQRRGAGSALLLFAPKPPRHLRSPSDRSPLVSSASASASGASTPASASPAAAGAGLALLETRFGGSGPSVAAAPLKKQQQQKEKLARRLARKLLVAPESPPPLLHPVMLRTSGCAGTVHEPPIVLSAALPAVFDGAVGSARCLASLALGAPHPRAPSPLASHWLGENGSSSSSRGGVYVSGWQPLRWPEAVGRALQPVDASPPPLPSGPVDDSALFTACVPGRTGSCSRLVAWYGQQGSQGQQGQQGPLPDARAGALVLLPGGGWVGAIVGDADGSVRLLRFGDAAQGLEAVGWAMGWKKRRRRREEEEAAAAVAVAAERAVAAEEAAGEGGIG